MTSPIKIWYIFITPESSSVLLCSQFLLTLPQADIDFISIMVSWFYLFFIKRHLGKMSDLRLEKEEKIQNVFKEKGYTKRMSLVVVSYSNRAPFGADWPCRARPSRSEPVRLADTLHTRPSQKQAASPLTGRARSGPHRWACTLQYKLHSCQNQAQFPARETAQMNLLSYLQLL